MSVDLRAEYVALLRKLDAGEITMKIFRRRMRKVLRQWHAEKEFALAYPPPGEEHAEI